MRADALYFNGRIYTFDSELPIAQAIVVSNGRIFDVGSSEDLTSRYKECTERHDLNGMTVIPGLIDAHAHFFDFAESLAWLDLSEARTFDEVVEMVAEEAKRRRSGEWILGRGWDQNKWVDKRFPTKKRLDAAADKNPVFLERACMHAVLVNSMAMKLSGIGSETGDPEGGRIVRDEVGEPTGILLDEAIKLVSKGIPPIGVHDREGMLAMAAKKCLSVGLVGVHEMGVTEERASIYERMYRDSKLPFRITGYYSSEVDDFDRLIENGPIVDCCEGFFSIVGVKFFSDGSLGARSAALNDDYSDDPGNRGIIVNDPDKLYEKMFLSHSHGFQLAVHAIGDRANRIVLDLMERIDSATSAEDARFRIEHAQVVSTDDIKRFASQKIIPSMQFVHCISDMSWVKKLLGSERLKGAYAWRSFLEQGCRIAGGSDFPVESHNPFLGIYAATTRMDPSGSPIGGWHPEQILTVEEALRAFTVDAAYAAHEDHWRGTLSKGKVADFVIISDDIINIPPRSILDISVVATVVGGKLVYRTNGSEID